MNTNRHKWHIAFYYAYSRLCGQCPHNCLLLPEKLLANHTTPILGSGLSKNRSGKRYHDAVNGISNGYYQLNSDQVTAQVGNAHGATWSVDKFRLE